MEGEGSNFCSSTSWIPLWVVCRDFFPLIRSRNKFSEKRNKLETMAFIVEKKAHKEKNDKKNLHIRKIITSRGFSKKGLVRLSSKERSMIGKHSNLYLLTQKLVISLHHMVYALGDITYLLYYTPANRENSNGSFSLILQCTGTPGKPINGHKIKSCEKKASYTVLIFFFFLYFRSRLKM